MRIKFYGYGNLSELNLHEKKTVFRKFIVAYTLHYTLKLYVCEAKYERIFRLDVKMYFM